MRNREVVEPLRENTHTLADHYRRKLRRYSMYRRTVTDHLLERVFTAERANARARRASTFLRAHSLHLVNATMRELHAERYSVEQILRIVVERAEKLGSVGARQPARRAAPCALDARVPDASVRAG